MEHRITVPCDAAALAELRAGDTVLLSGTVYTARDQAHKRMMEALDRGESLPLLCRPYAGAAREHHRLCRAYHLRPDG